MSNSVRDRVKELRRVKASELVENELNWRLHPEEQRGALQALFADVGFVGAIIARETEDGQLQIIDGHLRKEVSGDDEVPVLIVDLDETEAAKILATYDPLTQLAETDTGKLNELFEAFNLDDAFDESAELRKMITDMNEQLADTYTRTSEKIEEKDITGMALRPHEHYDYLVVFASTTQEWNILCSELDLIPEKRRKKIGTCRAIHASRLIERFKK